MKVLILNGSPRVGGNTTVAVEEMERIFREEGVEVETVQVGARDIRGCIACGKCAETGRCVFDDIVNELAPKLEAADGLVVASPVYYASANATLVACLTRLFYSSHFDKSMKVGASVVCARRGGCSATFDELNKFFTIAGMPVASSQYWNSIHGRAPGEAEQDEEGRQTMRTLARNMTFLMRSIALGREKYGLPSGKRPSAPISSNKRSKKGRPAGAVFWFAGFAYSCPAAGVSGSAAGSSVSSAVTSSEQVGSSSSSTSAAGKFSPWMALQASPAAPFTFSMNSGAFSCTAPMAAAAFSRTSGAFSRTLAAVSAYTSRAASLTP